MREFGDGVGGEPGGGTVASCNCRNRGRRSGGCHSHFSEVLAYKVTAATILC
jgi:hypothetical protein